jgi:translation initiation factor IF-1
MGRTGLTEVPLFVRIGNAILVMNSQSKNGKTIVSGVVTEALPDTLFRVKFDSDGTINLAYLAGKMRINRIKVLVGDKVQIELDSYGGKGRIIKRM